MSARPSVWVISHGSYSDYRVLCACPTEDAAKILVAKYNATERYEEAQVEELDVFDADTKQVKTLKMSTEVWDDGTTSKTVMSIRIEWPFNTLYGNAEIAWRWVRAPVHNDKGGRIDVWGTDHERVRKVFGERRALLMVNDADRAKSEATS